MYKNFIKTTFRNLVRNKTLSFIYFSGLSISMAAGMLIIMWVNYQFSFDRTYPEPDNIYRIYSHISMSGNNFTSSMAPPPLADLLKREFPEVIAATRVWKYNNQAVSNEENREAPRIFNEEVYQADSTFFRVFGFRMLQGGNADKSLSTPNTIVITRSAAIKFFGEDAFDKGMIPGKKLTITIDGYRLPCKITGITEDMPENAHFHYRIILSNVSDPWNKSQVWVDNTYYTYVLLKKGADPEKVEAGIPAAVKSYLDPQLRSNFGTGYDDLKSKGNYWEYKLQPVTGIHLRSDFERELEPGESIGNIYILIAAAVFLIVMACINHANLSTAGFIQRSKEFGVRKTLGSSKWKIVMLVFTETGLVSLIAWLTALLLIALFLSPFQDIMRTRLPAGVLTNGLNWAIFISLLFIVSLLGSIYPAFYLSSLNVVSSIKGKIAPQRKFINFKSALLVVQFFMFIGLAVCTNLVYQQLKYMRERYPGFNKENIVVVDDPSMLLGNKGNAFVNELKKDPGIISAGICMNYPGSGNDNFPISANYKLGTPDHLLVNFSVGYDFLRTFGISLIQGRDFNRQMDNDTVQRVILNEAAVKELGLQDPVGSFINTKYLNALDINNKRYEVIGVAKDFNFQSLHKAIRPVAIFLRTQGTYISVRIKGGDPAGTLSGIKSVCKAFMPGAPFEYRFLDETVDNLYKTEAVLSGILGILTGLIILVAIMGLTGLTFLTIQQRIKEIAIRKVIGASVYEILFLFSKEYIKWILISLVLVTPVAYFIMNKWLQGFANRISISWWVFGLACLSAIVISLSTISFQTIRAAMANPVKNLRANE